MTLEFSTLGKIALNLDPKVTYLKLIALTPSILRQYFKDLGPKITYLNKDLASLKPIKVKNWVQY